MSADTTRTDITKKRHPQHKMIKMLPTEISKIGNLLTLAVGAAALVAAGRQVDAFSLLPIHSPPPSFSRQRVYTCKNGRRYDSGRTRKRNSEILCDSISATRYPIGGSLVRRRSSFDHNNRIGFGKPSSTSLSAMIPTYDMCEVMTGTASSMAHGTAAFLATTLSTGFEGIDIPSSSILVSALSQAAEDPDVEAEILNDAAHVLLDLSMIVTPATLFLRLFSVIGRILGMAADYVPDHHFMYAEDTVLQCITLSFSFGLLVQSALPMMRAVSVKLTREDLVVFKKLFEPVGINWTQLRTLKAAGVLEWISVPAHTVLIDEKVGQKLSKKNSNITSSGPFASHYETQAVDMNTTDEARITSDGGTIKRKAKKIAISKNDSKNGTTYLYWLYNGDVTLSFGGSDVSYIERTSGKRIDDPSALGLLADMSYLYHFDEQRIDRKRKRNNLRHRYQQTKNRIAQSLLDWKKSAGRKNIHLTWLGMRSASATPNHYKVRRLDKENFAKRSKNSSYEGYPMATISTGKKGARLLRIDSTILSNLMDHDEELSESIRLLLLKSLQRKVGNLLRSKTASGTSRETLQAQVAASGKTTYDGTRNHRCLISSSDEKQLHELISSLHEFSPDRFS